MTWSRAHCPPLGRGYGYRQEGHGAQVAGVHRLLGIVRRCADAAQGLDERRHRTGCAGLMAELLYTDSPLATATRLTDRARAGTLGVRYATEAAR